MLSQLIKKILSWAMSRLLTTSMDEERVIQFHNWEPLPYIQAVYNIVENEDSTWRVDVHLFMEVTGKSDTDRVVTINTAYSFARPEFGFIYLQSMPPMFVNTASNIVVVNKEGDSQLIWDMNKQISEQPGIDMREVVQHALKDRAKEKATITKEAKPTIKLPSVPGNWTIN